MSGHGKESCDFISRLVSLAALPGGLPGAVAQLQPLIAEHHAAGSRPSETRLQQLCPSLREPFWVLPSLTEALAEVDARERLTARRHVPPSFRECRRLVNVAFLRAAVAHGLRLITLDGDCTLYDDGGILEPSSPLVPLLVRCLSAGITVAIVTAASYPGKPHLYEGRLHGLLGALASAIDAGAPANPLLSRLFVVGGQSSYLLRAQEEQQRVAADGGGGGGVRVMLQELPGAEWKQHRGVRWDHGAVAAVLDVAASELLAGARVLNLDILLVRKERAVGAVAANAAAAERLSYEVLEELALCVQDALAAAVRDGKIDGGVPICAFNGGRDVFLDIGDKALGLRVIQGLCGISPAETVHFGDRFTRTGNDLRARDAASPLWVSDPSETQRLLECLLIDVTTRRRRAQGEVAAQSTSASVAPGEEGGGGMGIGGGLEQVLRKEGGSAILLPPPPLLVSHHHSHGHGLDNAPLSVGAHTSGSRSGSPLTPRRGTARGGSSGSVGSPTAALAAAQRRSAWEGAGGVVVARSAEEA